MGTLSAPHYICKFMIVLCFRNLMCCNCKPTEDCHGTAALKKVRRIGVLCMERRDRPWRLALAVVRGEPLEYRILFVVDLHGCVRLLTQTCLTLTTLYHSKIKCRSCMSARFQLRIGTLQCCQFSDFVARYG